MSKDTGGPAFPLSHSHRELTGTNWEDANGITVRDYFAMHAPKEVPNWFVPNMREKPKPKWVSEGGLEYKTEYLAEQAVGDSYWDANSAAQDEWQKDYVISKVAQWPWFWADLQLEARKRY